MTGEELLRPETEETRANDRIIRADARERDRLHRKKTASRERDAYPSHEWNSCAESCVVCGLTVKDFHCFPLGPYCHEIKKA